MPVERHVGSQRGQDSDLRGSEGWNGLPRGSQQGCDQLQPTKNLASWGHGEGREGVNPSPGARDLGV